MCPRTTKMPRITILLWCFISTVAWGQKVTVSAKVVDRETREPLVFASVGVKDKPAGTITNLQGEFDFHIPAEYRNDILAISILGYKTFEAPVWTLLDKNNLVIELERTTFVLKEIVVQDSLTGSDILRLALSRIDKNYPERPYILDGFYRDIKKVGGTYISLLEAATKIYDEDYKAPRNKLKLRERVALIEVRRSLGYGNKFTTFFEQDNLLEELLLQNSVKYRHFPEEDVFFDIAKRKQDSYYNGHEIFVVKISADFELELYIDKTNFGIIHMEYSYQLPDNLNKVNKRRGMVGRYGPLRKVLDFRQYQGKLFLNYISLNSQVDWYEIRNNELKFHTELFQQLLINSINTKPEEWIGTTEKMKSYGLQYQDLPYNKDFWDNYNVIKESPLDQKIIKDLEKLGPLEKQFEDNKGRN